MLEAGVLAVAAALVAVPGSALARGVGAKPLVWLGRRSYALYVVHLPIFDLLQAHLGEGRPWRRAVIEIPLAIGVAHVAHVLIERPAQRRLRRLLHAEHRPDDHAPPASRVLA
jgi:peptidoglycan/LPS O-acetylase OafA/YrhL